LRLLATIIYGDFYVAKVFNKLKVCLDKKVGSWSFHLLACWLASLPDNTRELCAAGHFTRGEALKKMLQQAPKKKK